MPPKQKALDKKAANEAAAAEKAAAEAAKQEAASWAVGAKDGSKAQRAAETEELKRQKAAEKARLEAEDNAALTGIVVKKAPKKKEKGDLAFLNAALANAPKSAAQKQAEKKKQEAEEKKKNEEAKREAKAAEAAAEAERIKQLERKGIVVNHTDELMVPINNRLEEGDFESASGLEGAIDLMSMGGVSSAGGKPDEHPERRQKAMYNAYYEAELPRMKEEHPGLKLSQYKERIFDNWKSAPENPRNQPKSNVFTGAMATADETDDA